jgi:hypothetical protein
MKHRHPVTRLGAPALALVLLLCSGCGDKNSEPPAATAQSGEILPVPKIGYAPRQYVCYRADQALTIDGFLDEPAWQNAPWTEAFVDIEGELKSLPRLETRAKLLWDSEYLYVAADLVEPDVWASLTQRDAVIYHDNDFEVFIDPDMDTHEYYELEINALNTVWDLLLLKPYRDGGPAVNAWDIWGLKTAIAVRGTLNTPGDVDTGWSVEIAIPWAVLAECAHRPSPPTEGDQWKINFSRVEWQTEVKDGKYVKVVDPASGKSLPENNLVWSPQGLIAMHYPEMWGMVQFTETVVGSTAVAFVPDPVDKARWALRQVYYAERDFNFRTCRYTASVDSLSLDSVAPDGFGWPPTLQASTNLFEATIDSRDSRVRLSVDQQGRLTQNSK